MRLIDADEAKKALTGWDTDPTDEEIERTIDGLPTIVAAPVVHGRWDDFCNGKMCCCSVCKAEFDNTCNDIHGEWKFCPNCGAIMDGDSKAPTTPTTNHRVCKRCKTAVIGMEEYAECPECGHPLEEDANG